MFCTLMLLWCASVTIIFTGLLIQIFLLNSFENILDSYKKKCNYLKAFLPRGLPDVKNKPVYFFNDSKSRVNEVNGALICFVKRYFCDRLLK